MPERSLDVGRPRPAVSGLAGLALLLALAAGCGGLGVEEGGFNLVPLEYEWAMREDLHREVAQEMRVLRDPAAEEYLNRIGRRLAAQSSLGDQRWDFLLVESDAINAFNVPGGLVYVHTGLIREAATLDELTGVLAHEVAHGAARHGTQMMTRALGLSAVTALALGQDPGLAEQLIARVVGTGIISNYSRDAETEADRNGVRFAAGAGHDPRGMVTFFQKLLAVQGRRPGRVQQFFASHPVTEDRIAEVQAEIAALGAPAGGRDAEEAEYQRFRARFR
jgi:predicted Zn-dependent protease